MSKVTISPVTQQKMLNLLQKANLNSSNIDIIDFMFTADDKLFVFFDLKENTTQRLEDSTVLEFSESAVDHLVCLLWQDDNMNGFKWLKQLSISPTGIDLTKLHAQLKYTQGYIFSQVRSERSEVSC